MGLLDSFEKGLERAVNSAFAKTFRSGIQPVEIASALRRELDTRAAIVSRDRILAPNSFTVSLHPDDHARMIGLGGALDDELHKLVRAHATSQGYTFGGPLQISLVADPQVSAGTLSVHSESAARDEVSWRPVLVVDGTQHPLAGSRTVIGRGSDADITISDPGASRRHVEVLWDGERAMARDLGSTNGSRIDGRPLTEAPLTPDSTIRIGRTDLTFRVIAQQRVVPRSPEPDDATRAFDAWGDPRP